jgi:hypothetical protein
VLVLFSYKKEELEVLKTIAEKSKKYNIKTVIFDKKSKLYRLLKINDLRLKKVYSEICSMLKIHRNDFMLINFAWSLKRVQYPASFFLKICNEAYFFQDGATQYLYKSESKIFLIFKRIYDGNEKFWENEKLREIYVENEEKFPSYLRHKIKVISYNYNSISEVTKRNVMEVFVAENEKKEFEILEKSDGIIFTQPLSESRLVSEKEKIKVYKKIAMFYSKYGSICLKVHPRDFSDYSNLNVPIIKGRYPSEIINIMGIRFKFAIGICTCAIETIDADFRYNIGENYTQDKIISLVEIGDNQQ